MYSDRIWIFERFPAFRPDKERPYCFPLHCGWSEQGRTDNMHHNYEMINWMLKVFYVKPLFVKRNFEHNFFGSSMIQHTRSNSLLRFLERPRLGYFLTTSASCSDQRDACVNLGWSGVNQKRLLFIKVFQVLHQTKTSPNCRGCMWSIGKVGMVMGRVCQSQSLSHS